MYFLVISCIAETLCVTNIPPVLSMLY